MDMLSSNTGLMGWVDYLPVYVDNSATDAWAITATGFIPYAASGGGSSPAFTVTMTALSNALGTVTTLAYINPGSGGGGATTNLWSDPATWGGSVPLATDAVTIASGQTVILDTAAVCLSLDIAGTLTTNRNANISLTTGNINIGATGVLEIGTEASPFPAAYTCTIELNGAEVSRVTRTIEGSNLGFTNEGTGRSIQVQPGGRLNLIGVAPTVKRTKLNATVSSGAASFTLADNTGWKAGDEIAIGTTDFYGVQTPDKLTLASDASGTSITTTTGVSSARWGALQYVTDAGMSLTAGTLTSPPAGTPTSIDERAFVVNLTRNIIVQGANDSAWSTSKFGAHCMFMGRTSNIKLDGVQFRRVGQAGAIGRYPIHWHMMSYNMPSGMNAPSDGTFLGAVVGSHYVKNCAVVESGQRMVVIHGTHGVTCDSNVGFDITGHAIFLEDGAEQDNTITDNTIIKVRAPTSGNKLLLHDVATSDASWSEPGIMGETGTSGIWFTNPDNVLTGNWVNNSEGAGIWNSFSTACFGLSVNVATVPINIPTLSWDNNVSMGNQGAGALTHLIVANLRGSITDQEYSGNTLSNPIKRLNSFKNAGGGYGNRVQLQKYEQFVLADNAGKDVFGQATDDRSVGLNFLSVAESLNNATSRYVSSRRSAFATYHELLNFKDAIIVGYGWQDGVQANSAESPIGGGIFRMWDLYTHPVFSFTQNTGIKQINCTPPYRPLPPNLDGYSMIPSGQPTKRRNWTLAGAIKDVNGLFVPAGNTWIYDLPFFTYGASGLTNVAPSGSNGKHTPDRYFGVRNIFASFYNSTAHPFYEAINVSRQDSGGTEVGTWVVADGNVSNQLNGMRHFAAHNGGRYRLSFPGNSPATSFVGFQLTDMTDNADMFMMGVEFSGSITASAVWIQVNNEFSQVTAMQPAAPTGGQVAAGNARILTSTGSLANVVADTTGTIFFQETGTNTVWFKVKAGAIANNYTSWYGWLQNYRKPLIISVVA